MRAWIIPFVSLEVELMSNHAQEKRREGRHVDAERAVMLLLLLLLLLFFFFFCHPFDFTIGERERERGVRPRR